MHLRGVRLTARRDDAVTLEAHIDAATGDGHALLLTGVALHTPDGAELTTPEACWLGAEQRLDAPHTVQLHHPGGNLTAPSAQYDASSGGLTLQGPVQGDAQVSPERSEVP